MRQNQYPQRTVYRSTTVVRKGAPPALLTATGVILVELTPVVLRCAVPVLLVSPITVQLQPVALRGAVATTSLQRTFTLSPVVLRASLPATTLARQVPLSPVVARLSVPVISIKGIGELVKLRYRPRWLVKLSIGGDTKRYSSEDLEA